jgi:hypothetical protein
VSIEEAVKELIKGTKISGLAGSWNMTDEEFKK